MQVRQIVSREKYLDILTCCSCILRIKGCNHQHDSLECDRLLRRRHPRQLCLPRCHRDTHDYSFESHGGGTEACYRHRADEEDGNTRGDCRCSSLSLLRSIVVHPRARTSRRWRIYNQLKICLCARVYELIFHRVLIDVYEVL